MTHADATGRPRGRAVSIADVAALAAVSSATVSNVLNHPDRVAPATIEKVQRAIEMLGYLPNESARSLAAGRSRSVGLILSDLENSLFVEIARGAERAVREKGLTLLLANSDAQLELEQSYLSAFAQARALGTLITLNDHAHFAALSLQHDRRDPLVVLNIHGEARFCSAYFDNEHGGYLAAKHLIETGRRSIAFVGAQGSLQPVIDRRAGFRRALAEAGLSPAQELEPVEVNRSDGWQAGRALSTPILEGRIDGVVAASDLLAAGIVQALRETDGISIPGDVAIIGYDNNRAAWDSPVPISTIAQPGEELGNVGARLLLDEVFAEGPHAHEAVELKPTLVTRESTAATR